MSEVIVEDPPSDPVGGGPDQPEDPLVLPTEDELFLATLMQEQTITQERLDGSTKKLNYLKVRGSNLGLCIRELIKVYEDRIALSANTAPPSVATSITTLRTTMTHTTSSTKSR